MRISDWSSDVCSSDLDLWPAYRAFGDSPVLILRGQLSDILAKPVAMKMAADLPRTRLVEVAGVGHAPTLDEPDARAALDAWLPARPVSSPHPQRHGAPTRGHASTTHPTTPPAACRHGVAVEITRWG